MQHNLKKKYLISFRRFVLGLSGNQTINRYIGMTILDYRKYIKELMQDDMTWDNYKKTWDIDHLVPLCLFDLTNENEVALAFHAYNTIPMYCHDNKLKGSDCSIAMACLSKYNDEIRTKLFNKAYDNQLVYTKYIDKY